MWISILTWLLKIVLELLGERLDVETRVAVEAYERKRAEAEAARELAEIELGKIDHELLQLTAQRQHLQNEMELVADVLSVQKMRIEELNERKNKNLEEIRRLRDDDLLRSEL